jgi:amino acid transporter
MGESRFGPAGVWTGAYFNLPGFLIVFVLTLLLVRGVKESAETNNIMVAVKIGAILTFLVVGGMLVKPANWTPFAPSGFAGIVTGGAIVFFTYIGFDSVSTAAEESRNPQKDLPFGIIMSLVVCTALICRRRRRTARHDEVHDLRLRRSRRSARRLCDEVSRSASASSAR